MAGAFGGVQSLTDLPTFTSQHTRYVLSAEDAKRDARLYDVLTDVRARVESIVRCAVQTARMVFAALAVRRDAPMPDEIDCAVD